MFSLPVSCHAATIYKYATVLMHVKHTDFCLSYGYYILVPKPRLFPYTVEPPLKETPNKGQDSEHQNVTFRFITSEERNLSIMNRITCPKKVTLFRSSTV